MIRAYAALEPRGDLSPFEYELGPMRPDDVEIAVQYCGICHSDLSMIDNDWGISKFPLVPGHEVVGTVAAKGDAVEQLSIGQTVGLGWYSRSCGTCPQCSGGDHNLCLTNEQTIVARHGGFADTVRCHQGWAVPLPMGVNAKTAGPLFCGGITVFNPIVQFGVQPTDRVGVVGIGGLGHLAVQFLAKWGCDVTAFSSNPAKADDARRLGAHHVVSSRDDGELEKIAGSLDLILVTANVSLNWPLFINALRPKGRLHFVGAVLEPVPVAAFSLIGGQKQVSGSPLGQPGNDGADARVLRAAHDRTAVRGVSARERERRAGAPERGQSKVPSGAGGVVAQVTPRPAAIPSPTGDRLAPAAKLGTLHSSGRSGADDCTAVCHSRACVPYIECRLVRDSAGHCASAGRRASALVHSPPDDIPRLRHASGLATAPADAETSARAGARADEFHALRTYFARRVGVDALPGELSAAAFLHLLDPGDPLARDRIELIDRALRAPLGIADATFEKMLALDWCWGRPRPGHAPQLPARTDRPRDATDSRRQPARSPRIPREADPARRDIGGR